MTINIVQKSALLMLARTQKENDPKHLYIVLTHPCEEKSQGKKDMVLLVNFTSVKEGQTILDDTCVLSAGCHEFITKPSYILYREAKIEPVIFLENSVEQGKFIIKEAIEHDVYLKICRGLFLSKQISLKYKRFLKDAIVQNACPGINFDTLK